MWTNAYEDNWAGEVYDDDWPPKEPVEKELSGVERVTAFLSAAMANADDGSDTFTCPFCGKKAYRNVTGRKFFAAQCTRCGIRAIS